MPLGLPLVEACERAGVTVEAYLEHYDPSAALPFAGVRGAARAARPLGPGVEQGAGVRAAASWSGSAGQPEVALFSDDFGGREKELAPLLDAMGLDAEAVVFVGDTRHDRACAAAVGARFALAGWNPRARASAEPGDLVLDAARGPARPARLTRELEHVLVGAA